MNPIFLLALVMAPLEAAPAAAFDTVVICPEVYLPAMRPWLSYRMEQGHQIGVVTQTHSKANIRATIRQAAQGGQLQHVLLVGDIIPDGSNEPGVPTHHQRAVVNVHFGSEPHIATDNYYADLDDDQVPDVAIGRFSVNSREQLETIVAKTLAYETQAKSGNWRRRLHFVAGLGGFGAVIDSLLEGVTKKFLTDEIPPHFETVVAQGSWQSPYCPDPREFRDEVVRQLNDGSLFWVYMGHGQIQDLDHIRVPDHTYPILSAQDAAFLRNEQTNPIAIFLSCYTGAFDAPADCLGEHLLRSPGGPVAVFAGSRVTMPYGMSVLGTEMLQQYFQERQPTLGQLLLHAKRQSIRQTGKTGNRKMLDTMARMVSPKPELLQEERREHLALFNLLGDPLLRLPHAAEVDVTAPDRATPGAVIEVTGQTSLAGNVRVELVCRRDGSVVELPQRLEFQADHDHLSQYNQVYQQANNRVWQALELGPAQDRFTARLEIPETCRGPCHVRVIVEGANQVALGSHDILIDAGPAAADVVVQDQ